MSICGNMVGGLITPKSFVLVDENNVELVGVTVGEETVLTAQASDIKIGKVAATDSGITEGTDTKTCRVRYGVQLVLPGETFSIPYSEYDGYNYTKFQATTAVFNTTEFNSVAVDMVALYDTVYSANSNNQLSNVSKNEELKSIDLNLTNDTDNIYCIHFNTCKEEIN